jgi:hypothetical protein
MAAGTALALGMLACSGASPETGASFEAVNDVPIQDVGALCAADDIDPDAPGVQVALGVRAPANTAVDLRVGGQTYTATADADGRARFSSISLQCGPNHLRAEIAPDRGDSLTLELRAPSLSILGDASRVVSCGADDRDAGRPGIQTAVVVQTANVPDQTPVTLTVNEEDFSAPVQGGEALIDVTLPARSGAVALQAEAQLEGRRWTAAGSLRIQCAGCELTRIGSLSLGAEGGAAMPIILGPGDDEAGSAGLQSTIEVMADGLPGTAVTLRVDGQELETVQPEADGTASFPAVALADEANLEVSCTHPDAAPEKSRRQVRVDLVSPPAVDDLRCDRQGAWTTCVWTQPADDESPGGLASWSLRYQGGTALAEADFEQAVSIESLPAPSEDGQVVTTMFPSVPEAGAVVFALRSRDAAGNASALSNLSVVQP